MGKEGKDVGKGEEQGGKGGEEEGCAVLKIPLKALSLSRLFSETVNSLIYVTRVDYKLKHGPVLWPTLNMYQSLLSCDMPSS